MTSYIGREPAIGNFVKLDAISVVNGQAAYTMQSGSVNFVPESENHMLVSLNGIIQSPGSSFTVAGSTITFASALSTGDVINFIMVYGNVLDIGTPSDDTVSTTKLQNTSVTAAKLATDSVIEAKIQNDAVTRDKINAISTSSAPSFEAKGDGSSVEGKIQLNCHVNSHGVVLQSPPHSAGQSYTIKLPDNQIAAGKFIKIKSITGSGSTAVGQAEFADAGGGAYTKILHTTASNVANVAFNSTYLTSTYQDYKVVFSNVHCATDAQRFFLEVSADNGSSFKNLDQNVLGRKDDGSQIHSRYYNGSQADLQLQMNEDIGNDAGLHISGEIDIFDPSGTDNRKLILGRSGANVGDSVFAFFYSIYGAMSQDTDAINYLKFSWGSGNIASGEFTLYGRKIT